MNNAILFGNGINRCFGVKPWKDIVDNMSSKTSFSTNDNFLNVLTFDCQQIQASKYKKPIDLISVVLNDTRLKGQQLNSCKRLYKEFTDLPIDVYLTTNYSYEIEAALGFDTINGKIEDNCTDKREKKSSFKRANDIDEKKVFHIHGEERLKDSICIGLQHYIDNIAVIKGKINSIYSLSNNSNYEDNLKQALKGSWVEHLFFSNLFIVGFGLEKSEIDIWWLLAYRATLIAQKLIQKNNIVYYCTNDENNNMYPYLSSLYVDTETLNILKGNWKQCYSNVANMIGGRI